MPVEAEANPMDGVEEILPLAPAQAGMLFDALGGSARPGAYTAVAHVEIGGDIDAARLQAALARVAGRHAALRASFLWEGVKTPLSIVHRAVVIPFSTFHRARVPAAELAEELERHITAERLSGFDLTRPPLMRAQLFRAGDASHLIWSIHHLIADGWSLGPLMADLAKAYGGAESGADALPFRTLLAWRQGRGAASEAADKAYWTEALAGLPDPAPLETGPSVEGDAPALHSRCSLDLDAGTDQALGKLAQRLRMTRYQVLAAVWSLLLRRFGAGDDVVHFETNAGRPTGLPGVEAAVGPYVNTLPVRTRIDADQAAQDFLQRFARDAAVRQGHGFAALSDVQRWSGRPSGVPLAQTAFVSEGFPGLPSDGALPVRAISVQGPGNDPLMVAVHPGKTTRLEAWFDTELHEEQGVERLLGDYQRLLAAVVSRPMARISELLLPDRPPALPQPETFQPVQAAILGWAERRPDAPAVSFGDQTLCYADLARRVEAMAAALIRAGVTRGDAVPVALPRGIDAVVAMLAVLRAGAAYVPLDLSYPEERLRQSFRATAARHHITTRCSTGAFDATGSKAVCLEDARDGDRAPALSAEGSDPAYILFTSGSEGQPKGVTISHAGLAWSTAVRGDVYGAAPTAFLMLSSLAFDSSVVGLYWTLTTGGHLVLSEPRLEQDVTALGDRLKTHGISHLLCLPSLYATLLDTGVSCDDLETVIVAGEALLPGLIDAHRADAKGMRLFNEYGPTEATVWCSAYDTAEYTGGEVPIGRAIPGCEMLVADTDGAPLPDGAPGEILIRSPGVADGYLGDPAGTARRFAPQGTFRTGDIGVRQADGTFLFRGRRDAQVKLRGQRVDLSEIETALASLAPSQVCAAIALTTAGTTRLAAFSTPADLDTTRARRRLAELLPAHMVPEAVIAVPAMPRLPNGKTDRRRLEQLFDAHLKSNTAASDPPATETERKLAAVWQGVLGTETVVHRDADFFAIGGDSLKSITAMVESEAAGLALAPHEMFDHPVLKDLAAHLDAKTDTEATAPREDPLALVNIDGTLPPFFMLHGSPQMLSALATRLGSDRPLGFLFSHHLRGGVDPTISIEDQVEEAHAALGRLQPAGPYRIGGYSVGAIIAMDLARRLRDEGHAVEVLFLLDPSWEIGPPRESGHGGLLRRATHRRATAVSALRAAGHRLSRRLSRGTDRQSQMSAVAHAYRAALLRYRPHVYDGSADLCLSQESEASLSGAGWLADVLPTARRAVLPVRHLDLQKDAEAITRWTDCLADVLAGEDPAR